MPINMKALSLLFLSLNLGQVLGAQAGKYQQCGGIGFKGPTSCSDGWKCLCQQEYYSQCLPPNDIPSGFNQASCKKSSGSTSGGSTGGSTGNPPKSPKPPTSSPPTTQPSTGNNGGSCGAYTGSKTGYATTTRYYDGQKGACGCGSGNSMSQWQTGSNGVLTAAGSAALFDDGGDSSWCGSGCGTCYELTNAGAVGAAGQGSCAGAGSKITVMVTNLCPANGNQQWCSTPNQYGFGAHFDIMSQGNPNGNWDNPVVQYKKVQCPVDLAGNYQTCECAGGAKKSRVRRGIVQKDLPQLLSA